MDFQTDQNLFPIKENYIYLNHCGISPLYSKAARTQSEFSETQMKQGIAVFRDYPDTIGDLHQATAKLLRTDADNIAFLKNTAEGLNMLAAGYPIEPGDEIISYIHEYPSNHYPWRLLEERGAKLILLCDQNPSDGNWEHCDDRPRGWSMQELESKITNRTRIIAISHVQFTSGFAADLSALGKLSKKFNIDLIVDAAQSLGCLPIYPETCNIAAVAASGWKWLLGPLGTGLLYTSPALRSKLAITMAGPELMKQGEDYLDHTWNPIRNGSRFEYSTASVALCVALTTCLTDIFNYYGVETIHARILSHRRAMLAGLNPERFQALPLAPENESGIQSFVLSENTSAIDFAKRATQAGVFCSQRGGYLRLAPHFYITPAELQDAINILNNLI